MDLVDYHDVATVLGPNKTDSRQKEEFHDTNIPRVSLRSPSGILAQIYTPHIRRIVIHRLTINLIEYIGDWRPQEPSD